MEFERPLPYNVRIKWRAQLHRHAASVQHSGIQDLTIKFKWSECRKGLAAVGGLPPRLFQAC